ncbi:hypothetical protein N3930_47430, partial [Bacillus thuringiensis]|nr:hypothetical protein [Bacillus thuringiensis]
MSAQDMGTWEAGRPIEDAAVDGEGTVWVSGPDGVSEVVWDSRDEALVERNFNRVKSDGDTRLTGHHPRGATL